VCLAPGEKAMLVLMILVIALSVAQLVSLTSLRAEREGAA